MQTIGRFPTGRFTLTGLSLLLRLGLSLVAVGCREGPGVGDAGTRGISLLRLNRVLKSELNRRGVSLEREAGDFSNAMAARRGGARSPDRARAHCRAVPSGPLSLRFRLERGGRGDGPHLRVRNVLSCCRLLAARRRKRPAAGPVPLVALAGWRRGNETGAGWKFHPRNLGFPAL